MYSETTRSITMTVRPFYLEQHSSPADNHYVWAYHVRIENGGGETVQLRSRHWQITDGDGRQQEVRGPGVVGEQPVLAPGESFEYTSSARCRRRPASWSATTRWRPTAGESFLVACPGLLARQPAAIGPPELISPPAAPCGSARPIAEPCQERTP